jgi:hypothetical protein
MMTLSQSFEIMRQFCSIIKLNFPGAANPTLVSGRSGADLDCRFAGQNKVGRLTLGSHALTKRM